MVVNEYDENTAGDEADISVFGDGAETGVRLFGLSMGLGSVVE